MEFIGTVAAPLFGFIGEMLPRSVGRAGKRLAAYVGEPSCDPGVDFAVDLVDDLDGCVSGRREASPEAPRLVRPARRVRRK